MILRLVLAGALSCGMAGTGLAQHATQTVPQCAGVTLAASYLASVVPGPQEAVPGPGFRFSVTNGTSHAISLAEPVPSSAHWYARTNKRWLWRASNGGGGGLANAVDNRGRLTVYPLGSLNPLKLLTVPAHQSREWTLSLEEDPVLAYNPGCRQCSYPGERQYQVVFAYAFLPGAEKIPGLLACGLRSLPVPMPPKF